jgi:hypothetical protein
MAKTIVHARGGTLRLENRTEGGLRAIVQLPASVARASGTVPVSLVLSVSAATLFAADGIRVERVHLKAGADGATVEGH